LHDRQHASVGGILQVSVASVGVPRIETVMADAVKGFLGKSALGMILEYEVKIFIMTPCPKNIAEATSFVIHP
jgi:hypothetical protein